jgi:hypothetical protein
MVTRYAVLWGQTGVKDFRKVSNARRFAKQKAKSKGSKVSEAIRESPYTKAGIRFSDSLAKGVGGIDDFYGKPSKKSKKRNQDFDFNFGF